MSRLEELVSAAREDVERRRSTIPLEELRAQLGTAGGARPFSEALVRPGLSLIAEFKRRSPSSGDITGDVDVTATVTAYESGGAAARWMICEPPAPPAAFPSCARTSSSIPTSSPRPR